MLTAEIALTVTLLAAAGLLFHSFVRLRTADLGCRIDHVLTMKFGLPEIQYDTREKVLLFHQSLLERVRTAARRIAAQRWFRQLPDQAPKATEFSRSWRGRLPVHSIQVRGPDTHRGPAILQRDADSAVARPRVYGTRTPAQ